MGKLFLAANYVASSEFAVLPHLRDAGHLQIVYEHDNGLLEEIEVQSPGDVGVLGGDFDFVGVQHHFHNNHTPYINENGEITDADRYKRVELQVGEGRTADEVWELLNKIDSSISNNGAGLDYDIGSQNSNSYINTLLYSVGINLADYLGALRSGDIDQFPAHNTNVLLFGDNGMFDYENGVAIHVHGTEGKDYIRGGNNDDRLGGGFSPGSKDDGHGDYLDGGLGNDTYTIGFENSTNRNVHTEIVYGPGNTSTVRSGLEDYVDIVRDEDGQGSLKYTDGNGVVQTLKDYTFFYHAFGVGPNGWANQNGGLEHVWRVSPETDVNGTLSWSGRMLATLYSWTDVDTNEVKQGLLIFYDRGAGDPDDQEEYQAIVIIENFKNGDFGLFLPGYDAIHQGTDSPDDINAGTEDDQVDGGGGDDNLNGEEGDDTIEGGEGGDTINGGSGSDTASYEDSDAGVSIDLQTGVGTGGHADGDQLSNIENLIGSVYNDTLIGDANDNRFAGGLGADFIDGGDGIDTVSYYLDGSFENGFGEPGITVNLETGTASGLHAEGDILVNIENIVGTAAEDTLIGDANDNVLDGEDSVDAMHGGAGNDTIYMDKAAEFAVSSGGDGIDTIIFERDFSFDTLDFDLGSRGFENFITDDNSHHRIYGSDAANHIEGDRGNHKFYGYGGDDTLVGGRGRDQLFGGDGADLIDGGEDDDTIDGGAGDDTIDGGAGDDMMSGGSGDDTILGGEGNDSIDGEEGADILQGGDGDDTIFIDENDTWFSGDDGEDTVIYQGTATFQYALDQGSFEHASFGSGDDTLWGTSTHNTIDGGAGDDTLHGYGGNDHLTGGAGADSLLGGDGDDTIVIDDNDIWFSGDEGIDKLVYAGAGDFQYALDQGAFEHAETAAGDDTIWGSDTDNLIHTGAGDDTLFGYAGDDILIGGEGADSLQGGNGDDIIYVDDNDTWYSGGDGIDTIVFSSDSDIQYALDLGEFENADAGSGNDTILGNAAENIINGNAGDDVLIGGSGSDTLRGGLGNDILTGGSDAADQFHFNLTDGGEDTITDFQDGLDLLHFTGGIALDDISIAGHGDSGEHALLTIDNTDISIVLQNVDHTQITTSDFAFA